MTNSGAAQSKLGELFVDIGVGGLGKTLKALNSVSASFLLTKNAAVQMAKPIVNTVKQTMGMAVDVGKLGSTLGIAYKDAYKLQYYFKHMNLNEGLVNDIEKISEQFSLIAQGQGKLSDSQMLGFANLGLNWQKYYGGGFDKAQQFIKDLQMATANMNRTKAATSLQQIGMSTDWLYAFDRGVFDLSDALSISNQEIESAIAASESLNEANLALQKALQDLTIVITPYISEYAPKIANAISTYAPKIAEGMRNNIPPLMTALDNLGISLNWIGKILEKYFGFWTNLYGTVLFNVEDKLKPKNLKSEEEISLEKKGIKFKRTPNAFSNYLDFWSDKYRNIGDKLNDFILPDSIKNKPPNMFHNLSTSINIVNNITGESAPAIAQKTTEKMELALNKFQVSNIPGK